MREQEIKRLEEISGLSADAAKESLIEGLRDEAKSQAQQYINEIVDEAKMTANKEAKKIVIQSIQRVATETAVENSVTVFHIDSDEVKGRVIGREGRNIRALEAATGVELVVDDTPEAIVISAFDPVRREIARLALHQLVVDGRIHPARIEEVVAKVQKQLEDEILETGKRTCIDLGVHGLNIELVKLIGRMKYRSSYGQNLLQHSREVASISAIMASELGLNPKAAKRAGLLHDIGRFEQVRRYDTFNDAISVPHAALGVEVLFHAQSGAEPLIRSFVADPRYDKTLRAAIAHHSDYLLPAELDEPTRALCDLLRDADKIDIIKVNCICPIEDIYGVSELDMERSELSPDVIRTFYEHRTIPRGIRNHPADVLVGHICFSWELVHPSSRAILFEQGYLDHMLDRRFELPHVQKEFEQMAAHLRSCLYPQATERIDP